MLALLIAAAGVGGMLALAVNQRWHEIGIRVALGAKPRDVVGMILREGMALVVAGLAVGLVAAIALTRMLESLLFEVGPFDPATFVSVSLRWPRSHLPLVTYLRAALWISIRSRRCAENRTK